MSDLQTLPVPQLISAFLMFLGILYAAALLIRAYRTRDDFRREKGNLSAICVLETAVYFFATIGMSDFLPNTIAIRTWKIMDDKTLPGTLIAAALTPGAVIAFFLLRAEKTVELWTLLPCCIAITLGAAAGAKAVGLIDRTKIRRIMGCALIFSLAMLIVRMVISRGVSGTATGLSGWKLVFAIVFSFFWGAVNMLGVPMKAAGSAVFLLLGTSPLATLTYVLVMGCLGPMGGGIAIIREGRYHQKMACASVVFGSLGAAAGSMLAVSISASLLNILLLCVLAVAIVTMLKPA